MADDPSSPRRGRSQVEKGFRSFMAGRRKGGVGDSASRAAQLRDLQVQAKSIEQRLQENEARLIIAQVRRRFGDQAAAAVEQASEASRQRKAAALQTSTAAAAHPYKPLDMSGPTWEGTKVGLAAAAGGTALLILTSPIPVLAVGVGLALVGGGAGAATASSWRKRSTPSSEDAVSADDVQRWKDHVGLLNDKLQRSEAITSAASASASGQASMASALLDAGAAGDTGTGAPPALPPRTAAPPSGRVSPHPHAEPAGPGAAGPGQASSTAHGTALAGAAPRAQSPEPAILHEAFAQVRQAMHSDPSEWRLKAVYGAARVLGHMHGGGQAPMCAVKGVVQVDAPPRSVRDMVLQLRDERRHWDLTFEIGNSVDVLSPNSDVAHVILSSGTGATGLLGALMGTLAADRDLVLWRHWAELPPDATAADAEVGASGAGYLVVCASTYHAACPPVHGLLRATCHVEAWYIKPMAFSVRSEVTHFCALSLRGALGAVASGAQAMQAALHRPFFERLGALALYANVKHGCLAVPLPRDGAAADADADADERSNAADAPAVRTYQPATGLADDVFHQGPSGPCNLTAVPNVGGVNGYSQPKAEMFRVRSKGYLSDRLKLPSAPAALDIASIYAFRSHHAVRHFAAQPESPLGAWRAQGTCPPFVFIINMIIVGNPGFQGIFIFGMNEEEWGIHKAARDRPGRPTTPSECFHKLLAQFCSPDLSPEANKFRDERFKLLPAIVQGPMLLKNSSGNRPAILGNKLKQSYYAGDGYFEVDVDCTTSRAAASVVNMVKGYCSTLVIDLAFILQGNTEEELPERVLGVVRFSRVDMDVLYLRPHQPESSASGAGAPTTTVQGRPPTMPTSTSSSN
eukprot:CAMPEP_0185157362 /NCGR_PEP_ID=MMETSP1139-20130426/1718_1 /TAXON_ID=298111 /ORGANISM="Pavlova sp., Strain CCMP459" /LENGTH=860 /DNA_ID=CAMNT_0027722439 /DNA_START=1 /DNA_END=2583 /DNA_ORIENTATION=-